jgi:ribonuclease HI
MKDEVQILVCGSCVISGDASIEVAAGNGGYGVVIYVNGQLTDEISGGFANTTNARIEMHGIAQGLLHIKNPSNITVFILNGNIVDTFAKGWIEKWKRNGFKKIKNVDIWKELDKITVESGHSIVFERAQNLRNSAGFLRAEDIAKTMANKQNLPDDLPAETMFFSAKQEKTNTEIIDNSPIMDSVCVDASTSGNPGVTEYRAVDTQTRKVIFNYKLQEATNNIGEFLGIVHTLAKFKSEKKPLKIIYSDSRNAILWVRQKVCKTNLAPNARNQKTFEVIERAVKWLKNNDFDTKILKWNTALWGEIPADYGRK